jgi:hypothetical protein
MEKHTELKRAKLLALSLLLIAGAAFIATLFLPQTFWVRGEGHCRGGNGWRAGGLVCGGGAISPRAGSVYLAPYGDYPAK